MEKSFRSRKPYRRAGFMIDLLDFSLSVVIIILGTMNIVNPKGNARLFPLICIFGAVLNATMSIKYYMRKDRVRAIGLTVAAVFLAVSGVASFIALWL